VDVTEVNTELFGRLLCKIEALADLRGWDQPPTVYVIYERAAAQTAELYGRIMAGNGPPLTLGGYVAQPYLGPETFAQAYAEGLETWNVLTNFTENVAFAHTDESATMVGILRQPGVLGFAFLGEAYRNEGRETLVRAVFGEFHLGELPTSRECRLVYGHDVTGQQYMVERLRGEPAELDLSGGRRGDFSAALGLLCDVVNDTVPALKDYRRKYPTLRETFGGRTKR
jgi:hypothetical protein